ncbi:GNAT family N-acetyltransferase [Chitinophaga ginsengisegetis]|uniref:GNAT family N-acetyltransferase n=1 Tax=Chitinophaga ginsengisegetis TaxID=393003 RepID=UPI000DB982AD|nr:GNAT family N-acetyltransferase [Chitinophaga ginsengisegetis]MDR6569624.1 GNAT superfamily N-acetyltransferase [Chitinophaga ginsengisegetis]MDR6649357.1 GNAT superfamily N-acetyltransferase [Chitinophaga ginsengisegetis]MDR6655707.1 GNAT superfamily N-acetyltransferase [Chitinophaga ginsengisegetis]
MYHVKTATVNDIPVIQDLTEKIWRPTYQSILTPEQIEYMIDMMYSTASLNKQITELQHQFLILQDDSTPIGFASYSTTGTPGIFKLQKIYLDGNYQGKGVGKFLLEQVAQQVKERGANILELDVNRFNKAKQFYEKQGFSVYKEKKTDIGSGYIMDDYVMRKPL